ncbi:MAG: glycosyltransferase family 4 protein [Candidatus Saccharicenans sp.]|nr:glycosyltransferase family 4 protein [Candidatus Saccharicenans sp.]
MSKSLWILNHYAISPDMPGGTRHFDLARELVRKGYDVTIFASGFDHVSRKYLKLKPKERMRLEEYEGVRFVWINTFPYTRNNWRRLLNMLSYGWRVLGCDRGLPKPDAVIGSSMHPFAALAAWWLARRYKARFFFEVRDLWPQTAVDMGAMKPNGLPAKVLYAWEKFMYDKAEKIIVLLPHAKDYVVGRGLSQEKVVWLPNGVNLERFDHPEPLDPTSEVARVFEKFKDKFKVVYTGAHGEANGLEVIIHTANIMRNVNSEIHFFLIGDGPEKSKLERKTKEMGLNNVFFLPPVTKDQVPNVLARADLLLHTLKKVDVLRYGMSPNKMFDYLASAKPVVTSIEAINNPVEEAAAGKSVPPEDPEALARAIIEISQLSEEERAQLGKNGRRYVEQFHNIKVLAERLESLLGWGDE